MITTTTNDRCHEYYGLSTDKKPTEFVGNGSIFVEMDTLEIYMFDESKKVWLHVE